MAERLVTLSEVKELLEKAEADRGELTYEQKLALEHARRFGRFTPTNLKTLVTELQANPKVDLQNAIRIADTTPTHADDVRAIFAKSRATLDDSEVQKILESVQKYIQA